MTRTHEAPSPQPIPLELRWDETHPLPSRWVIPDRRGHREPPVWQDKRAGLDFSAAMLALCEDIVGRCEMFAHIDMSRILVSFTPCRNRNRYGLQARVTPLRFHHGALTRPHGSTEYQVQRLYVEDREMLYVLTFCLPRFLDQPFHEKLVTIFHELYHIGPDFDGDLRRHPGRYAVHTHSKTGYDSHMAELVNEYLDGHSRPEAFEFLEGSFRELCDRHGGVHGVVVPRPKILPVGWAATCAAARKDRQ